MGAEYYYFFPEDSLKLHIISQEVGKGKIQIRF